MNEPYFTSPPRLEMGFHLQDPPKPPVSTGLPYVQQDFQWKNVLIVGLDKEFLLFLFERGEEPAVKSVVVAMRTQRGYVAVWAAGHGVVQRGETLEAHLGRVHSRTYQDRTFSYQDFSAPYVSAAH